MDKKKMIYQIITSIWELLKLFNFKKLSDSDWERLIELGESNLKQYSDKNEQELFRDMFLSVTNYYEKLGKE